jgi:hypothetical protein
MRIVDKRRDYYDGVQATGQDRSIQYIRTPEVIEMAFSSMFNRKSEKPLWTFPVLFDSYSSEIHVTTHIVGFCGNIYGVLALRQAGKSTFCVNLAQVDAYMAKTLDEEQHRRYRAGGRFNQSRSSFNVFFEACAQRKETFRHMFEEKRSPIFLASHGSSLDRRYDTQIEWNALLGQVHFQKVFPPFQAFQEIRIFLSNMAQPEKPIPQLSDEDMAHSKGHGDRYSFRTAPGTKPGRKRK